MMRSGGTADQAANFQTGTQLRSLFVLLLLCEPVNPLGLWESYKLKTCDDLPCVLQTRHQVHAPIEDPVLAMAFPHSPTPAC